MGNLVAIMSIDISQVETLSATNILLAKQITEKHVMITRFTKEMSNLVSIITKMFRENYAADNDKNNGSAGRGSFDKPRAKNAGNTPFDPIGYCLTHGYRVSFKHSSTNCKYKAEGHKTEATRANTMGGKIHNKYWVKGL